MDLNLNKINKKIVVFFSFLGFLLGFIAGLASGTSFINLVFRSIMSGIIMGFVIAIVNIVIIMFLPELLDNKENEDDEITDSDGHVDIIMPEESYQVQNDNISGVNEENSNDNSESNPLDASFKEVDLDNLQNLSGSDKFSNYDNATADDNSNGFSGESEMSSYSSVSKGSEMSKNSVEDMAKAVQTILKKD